MGFVNRYGREACSAGKMIAEQTLPAPAAALVSKALEVVGALQDGAQDRQVEDMLSRLESQNQHQ